jgi:hypothetical protein
MTASRAGCTGVGLAGCCDGGSPIQESQTFKEHRMKNPKFPDQIFVQHYMEEKQPCGLIASETQADVVDADLGHGEGGKRVGIYQLITTVEITKTETFHTKKIKN